MSVPPFPQLFPQGICFGQSAGGGGAAVEFLNATLQCVNGCFIYQCEVGDHPVILRGQPVQRAFFIRPHQRAQIKMQPLPRGQVIPCPPSFIGEGLHKSPVEGAAQQSQGILSGLADVGEGCNSAGMHIRNHGIAPGNRLVRESGCFVQFAGRRVRPAVGRDAVDPSVFTACLALI